MPKQVLIDNDIVLKTACYELIDETLAATTMDGIHPAILAVGKFVVRGRLRRGSRIADPGRAMVAFERMLHGIAFVEPDDVELSIAADLEAEANRRNLELDGGESQLLAVLANRGCHALVTGDKRAIHAMAIIGRPYTNNNIVCLEQLISHLVYECGFVYIRDRICLEPAVDRAIGLCFSCEQIDLKEGDALSALASYINHLNQQAPGALLPAGSLSGRAPIHADHEGTQHKEP